MHNYKYDNIVEIINTKMRSENDWHLNRSPELKNFFSANSFDVAAVKCLTIEEVQETLSIPHDFIMNYCFGFSLILPVAGLECVLNGGKTYRCLPAPLNCKFEGYHNGTKPPINSLEKLAKQHRLQGFVVLKESVETILQASPEWGREKAIELLPKGDVDDSLQFLRSALKEFSREELRKKRWQFLAHILHEAGFTNEVAFSLLDGKAKIEKGSEYKRLERWRDKAIKALEAKGFPAE